MQSGVKVNYKDEAERVTLAACGPSFVFSSLNLRLLLTSFIAKKKSNSLIPEH